MMAALGMFSASCSKTKYVWRTEDEYYKLTKWSDKVSEFKKVKMEPNTAKLFIGDSITEGYDLQRAFADNTVVNMGIGGEYTTGILMRMDIARQLQPAKIFLMIGINDITTGISQAVLHQRYANILSTFKQECPQTQVYVQSTLPTRLVGGTAESNQKYIDQVKTLNEYLASICATYGYTYIDLYALFEKEEALNANYTYDGIHISPEGYAVWTEAIRHHVVN
ncbi:MAG: GDSL-type esterase/lipase family protein [Flavobacteriales bacterium]